MGKHHLLETEALQPFAQAQFVQRLTGGMQQHHGAAAATGLAGSPHRGGQGVIKVQGFDFEPIGPQTPGHLQHLLVEGDGPDRLQGKEFRTVLIADQQGIGKACVHQQQGGGAAALEQGIGGDGGAQPQLLDQARGYGGADLESQQLADGRHRGIPRQLGLERQDFAHHQGAVGWQGNQVGEGAAPIHPETPAGLQAH